MNRISKAEYMEVKLIAASGYIDWEGWGGTGNGDGLFQTQQHVEEY